MPRSPDAPAAARAVGPGPAPLQASDLGFVVASATVLHLSRDEISSAVTTIVLFVLAAFFVAYAR